jgi:hypothetical protein
MTIYVDVLAAPDYLIVDQLSFDDAFWATNQTQLQADAAKYGKELSLRSAAPNTSPTPITSMTQFDWRMSLSDTSPAPPVTAPSTPVPTGGLIAVGIIGAGILGWALLSRA